MSIDSNSIILGPEVILSELTSEFRDRYEAITALRLLALNSSPDGIELRLSRFAEPEVEFLRSPNGKAELTRWQHSFLGAFENLDYAYSEIGSAAGNERPMRDWWASIEAEEIALNAIQSRVQNLLR